MIFVVLIEYIILFLMKKYSQENVSRMGLVLFQFTSPVLYLFKEELSLSFLSIDSFYLFYYVTVHFLLGIYNLYNLVNETKNKIDDQINIMLFAALFFIESLELKLIFILSYSLWNWSISNESKKNIDKRLILSLLLLSIHFLPSFSLNVYLSYFIIGCLLVLQGIQNNKISENFTIIALVSLLSRETVLSISLNSSSLVFLSIYSLRFLLIENHLVVIKRKSFLSQIIKRIVTYLKVLQIRKIAITPLNVRILEFEKIKETKYLEYKGDAFLGLTILLIIFLLGMVSV